MCENEVAQSCPTLSSPMDCSPPGSSIHGIFQARVLEWVAISPIADKYGYRYALVAAMMHYCMVTTVPELHGAMCLYNGGFTAALVCLLMVPGLERHFHTRQERKLLHRK